ncbi:nitroreductase family protein [Jatrophihabitans sp. YIM 134969]
MEFGEVVRRRRMVRRYDPDRGVPRETVDALLALAVQAPSAGFSQGWGFLVLDTPTDVDRYWALTAPDGGDSWVAGMRTAPVLLLALSDPDAYARRYARADKARSSIAVTSPVPSAATPATSPPPDWPVPWWDVDTGMAALLVLLGATDHGLGACLAGVPADRWDAVREAFGVPARYRPVGIVTVGHPAPGATGGRGRARRPVDEVVRRGRWSA